MGIVHNALWGLLERWVRDLEGRDSTRFTTCALHAIHWKLLQMAIVLCSKFFVISLHGNTATAIIHSSELIIFLISPPTTGLVSPVNPSQLCDNAQPPNTAQQRHAGSTGAHMKYECREDTQTETEGTQLERFHLHPVDADAFSGACAANSGSCLFHGVVWTSSDASCPFNSPTRDRFPTLGGVDARRERTRSNQEVNYLELKAASRTTHGSQQASCRCQ